MNTTKGFSHIEQIIVLALSLSLAGLSLQSYQEQGLRLQAKISLDQFSQALHAASVMAPHYRGLQVCPKDPTSPRCGQDWSQGVIIATLEPEARLLKTFLKPKALLIKAYLAKPRERILFDDEGLTHQNGRYEFGISRRGEFHLLKTLVLWHNHWSELKPKSA